MTKYNFDVVDIDNNTFNYAYRLMVDHLNLSSFPP